MADPFNAKSGFPSSIRIGQYMSWSEVYDYDSSLFSLAYLIRPSDGAAGEVTVPAVADGTMWTFEMLGALSATVVPGSNVADLICTRIADGEKLTLATVYVDAYIADEDRRSHARLMITKIESLLSGRADDDVSQYSIKDRSITKMSVKELTEWRDFYRSELASEPDAVTGKRPVYIVKVGFIR